MKYFEQFTSFYMELLLLVPIDMFQTRVVTHFLISIPSTIIYVSFIVDIILVIVGKILYKKKKKLYIDIYLNLFFFRFIPILSHIGVFRSGCTKYSYKKLFLYLFLSYIVLYIVSSIVMMYYLYYFDSMKVLNSGFIISALGIIGTIIYLGYKKVGKN